MSLVLESVSRTFRGPDKSPVRALRDVSLVIQPGEYVSLVGPSGSGKTTLLRLAAGLDQPDSGTISLDGIPPDPQQTDIALVFQSGALWPHLTARENIALGLRARRLPRATQRERLDEAAAWTDIAPLLDRRPAELSVGQAQRVALARAAAIHPRLLLLDEPLANLDLPARHAFRLALRNLHRQLGSIVLHVTHDQSEALAMGRRVVLLHQGEIQQFAPPRALYQNPANLFVAQFFAPAPSRPIPGTLQKNGTEFHFDGGWVGLPVRPAAPDNSPLLMLVRPDALAPGTAFQGAIEQVDFHGADCLVTLCWKSQPLSLRLPAHDPPEETATIGFVIDWNRVHFFDRATGRAVPSA